MYWKSSGKHKTDRSTALHVLTLLLHGGRNAGDDSTYGEFALKSLRSSFLSQIGNILSDLLQQMARVPVAQKLKKRKAERRIVLLLADSKLLHPRPQPLMLFPVLFEPRKFGVLQQPLLC